MSIDSPVKTPIPAAIPGTIPEDMPAELPTAAERVSVAFAGEGAGAGEMTWGQWEIWLSMCRLGWVRMGGVLPVSPGTTVQDVAEELGYIMSRYPSMRTLLRFDENGRPTQEIFGSGEIGLEVYDAADRSDPEETATAVKGRYMTAIRDFAGEWPLRMGVVRQGGALTHLVVITCHLASDGAGMGVLSREVQAKETAPVAGTQPLDLVRWQRSAAGDRQNAVALKNTETVMRSVPPRPLSDSSAPEQPRHWTGELTSPALRLAVQVISERTRAGSSTVLQALYAIALGRRGLMNPVVLRPLVSNRFRTGLANVVCNLVQSGIFVVDVAETTVDEAVARAKHAGRTSYKYSYFDPEQELALIERIAQEQGPDAVAWSPRSWSYLNDRRANENPVTLADEDITPARMKELVAASTFRWSEKKENPNEPLFLYIEESSDSISIIVSADTQCVPLADNEGLARDMEAIAVEAVFDPQAPTLVPAAPRS